MSIKADCHLHSNHSGDCDVRMEDMILKGISLGLDTLCFTEHMDVDYPALPGEAKDLFLLNTDSYLYDLAILKEKYQDKIRILFGVELGLQPHLGELLNRYSRAYDFDFIIGSTHVVNGRDPYYPGYFDGRSKEEAIREYLTATIDNLCEMSCYDVYGHLDYLLRYAPDLDQDYSYEKYKDLYELILMKLITDGKGLELNTGGISKGLRDFHPCKEVLKRYKELGGEIITIGSDSHGTEKMAHSFDRACELLQSLGFEYYAVYKKRVPEFIPLK